MKKKREVVAEDFELYPELVEGLKVGDIAKLPPVQSDDSSDDEDSEDESDEDGEDADDEESDADSVSFQLLDRNHKSGRVTRTFSADNHGKDFKKVAKEFAETNKHRIIKKSNE